MNRGSIGKDDVETVDQSSHVEHITKPSLVTQVGDFRVVGLTADDADFYNNYSEEKRKKVFHKVDKRLIPMLAVLYLICHIDRANIGNAKIEGMVQDLNMTGLQYNTVLSIFFIPYVLFEVPSNIVLKKFKRPSTYLGLLVLSWGIIMTCTGLVKNFAGLMTTRVLLGAFEAGFFPGAIYLCSYWYMPKELALRISYFYCASALSGAFSGLLAAAIAKMDGTAGLEGWRWIFILEGLASVVLGIACFFLLIDTPALSKRWLSPEEIRYLELSMFIKQGGTSTGEGGFKWRDLKVVLLNWRIYVQGYLLFCQSALSYGTKFTLPTITKAMGFSSTNAQLTSAPPYIAGAISAIVFARFSDRFYWRMPFVCIPMVIVVVAYSIIMSLNGALEEKKGVAYFAVVLSVIGIYPIQPRLHANPSRHRDWQDQAQHIRSQNPSPEPITMQLEPVDNTTRPRLDKPSRKRKWPVDAGPPAGPTPPPKRQKTSAGEDKKDNEFCWEVGQEFLGFVSHVDGEIAKEIARSIHKLPVPTEVHKRLIYFCDASIRSECGAAGVVWQENFGSSNWKGTGFHYPESTVSTATVELFAISCTMQMAIGDINTERGTVVPNKPVDTALFQQHSAHTLSHLHNLTKEVFIFTDDSNALRRIDGLLAYDPNGDMGRQVEAISTHSKTLSDLGVHVELHLSPGHSAVPGNVAADRVAKRTAGITMASEAEHKLTAWGGIWKGE